MTDNDIKKSIEWHLNSETNCDECSYKDFKERNGNCVGKMLKDALDLINRKDAEIERLKVERDKEHDYCNHYVRMCAKAKSEAIKEFAKRLRLAMGKFSAKEYWEVSRCISNLVKEMTEVSENG